MKCRCLAALHNHNQGITIMAFCEQCGTQLGAGVVFCGSCGRAATLLAAAPVAAQLGTTGTASATPADDHAGLPEKWQRRFAAIEKAGGERVRWWRMPEVKLLTRKEKRLITSNLWAFMFGPFYYLYLGMWRKAITLSVLALVIDVLLGMAGAALNLPVDNFLWIVSAIMFKQCANVDYYRKTVLKRREWW
jgi:hypothetical protein